MPPDALAADNGPLSIEQAIEDITEKPEQEAAPVETEQPTETPNTEAEPAAEDATGAETPADGESTEEAQEQEEGDEPQLPALQPPALWTAEEKKDFDELPRHLQERLLAKETEANRVVSKKMEETAAVRKSFEGEASKYQALSSRLDKLIPEAEQTFAAKWGIGEIDWNRVAQEQGVERAFAMKNDFDREAATVQQLKTAKQEVDAIETQKFVATRFEELKTLVPEFGDAKTGPAKQLELVNYISANYDVPAEVVVKQATAKQLLMGHKAYLYDKLNADAKALASTPSTPTKPASAARPSVKPTAAPARPGSSQQVRLKSLEAAFNRDPSFENLVALQEAQGT